MLFQSDFINSCSNILQTTNYKIRVLFTISNPIVNLLRQQTPTNMNHTSRKGVCAGFGTCTKREI